MSNYNEILDLVIKDIKMVEKTIQEMTLEKSLIAINKIFDVHQPIVIENKKTGIWVNCVECTDVHNERISWPCHSIEAIVGEEL